MEHKVNPHFLRTGVIKNFESKWDGLPAGILLNLNGTNFKNLQVCNNITIFQTKSEDVKAIVKNMKKR